MAELRSCEVGALFIEGSVTMYENDLKRYATRFLRHFCTMQRNMKALENIFFTFGLITINN